MFGSPGGAVGDDPTKEYVKHFGTLYVMQDYETTTHSAFVNVHFAPTSQLSIAGTFSYVMTEAALNQVVMPHVTGLAHTQLEDMDFTFDQMHEYSNLEFTYLLANIGLEYALKPNVTLTLGADYADLTDDQPYVYGDQSGSMFMVRGGVRLGL